ncbi:MAG: RagB/SusD family nutrient uptake outer membrane protein [Cyclobacteriaceae bacterium]
MKNLHHILLSITVLMLVACEDQLDQPPISERGSNSFYQNANDFVQAINGAYAQLSPYPIWHFELSEIRSDNMYVPGLGGVRDYSAINNFSKTLATATFINDTWNGYYNGIMRANTVLNQLNADVVPDEALRNRLEGEARFLRAFFYFDMIRWFGKVPLITEPVSPLEALNIPRAPVSEVYEVIIEDLQEAIGKLPDAYPASDLGRVTAYAARGILARVYLTRSGPQLHPDGPSLGTNDYEAALTLLNEIINSGQYALLENYGSIFDYENENNAEIVFDIQYQSGGLGIGGEYVSQQYAEAFSRAVGIPFAGGAFPDAPKTPSDDLLSLYQETDTRKEASIADGYTDVNGNYVAEPFVVKYLDLSNLGVDRFDFELNYPVIRYADVLMMKAEAILQGASGSQAEVDAIVNEIRARAGLTTPVSNVTLEMLLDERRLEFAGEGLRWHDLVRTGRVLDNMNAWLVGADDTGVMPSTIDETTIIYPVPQNQIDIKEGLYDQNPGY